MIREDRVDNKTFAFNQYKLLHISIIISRSQTQMNPTIGSLSFGLYALQDI